MSEKQESSVLFSLKELMNLEEDRIKQEDADRQAQADAQRRAAAAGAGIATVFSWSALLGVALGSVLIPQLSAAQARGDADSYSGMLDWGLRLALLLSLPCAAALVFFPEAMIATLFQHGKFDAVDVVKTAAALRGYGVGLIGIIGVKILAPGFYARQDMRTPVTIASPAASRALSAWKRPGSGRSIVRPFTTRVWPPGCGVAA